MNWKICSQKLTKAVVFLWPLFCILYPLFRWPVLLLGMERTWDVWWWHRSKCSCPKANQSSWLCKADLNWMWGRTLHGPLSNSTLDLVHLKLYHHGHGWTSLDCVAQKHYKRIAHNEHNSWKLQKFFLRLKGTSMHIKVYWFKNGFMGPFHRNLPSYPQVEWQTFCLDAIPLKKE